ncbi:MAG TPA: methionyl-tRNA formyltransferase [Candidatus Paceibacterota bacterium]|nr:methionyl-tRNA formyltransferase [Candidatus Paceibacterota bacterium]
MNFIFFGSNNFSKMILEGLIQKGFKPLLVVAPERKPQSKNKKLLISVVEELALKENILVTTPSNLNEESFLNQIKNLKTDFALLSAYGKIIPLTLLQMFPKGFLNLHPSLLPKLRGATPIQTAILNNEPETGVSLFLMDEKIDHGPIIAQKKVEVDISTVNFLELSQKLAEGGVNLIVENLEKYLKGEIVAIAQDDSQATYCHKITKEDEKINWSEDALAIDRKVRALNPNPGTYTLLNNKIFKIIKGNCFNDSDIRINKKPGEIFEFNQKMAVKCGKGFYLIEEIKPEGKKIIKASDFLKGNRGVIGRIFN